MFEFFTVPEKRYVDPVGGEDVTLRILHRTIRTTTIRTVDVKGRDMDLLAFQEMGLYEEMMRLAEQNSRVLSERRFRSWILETMEIPA